MTRRHLGRRVSRAAALASLHELAVLCSSELMDVAGGPDQAQRIIDWLRNEADEAAAVDQTLRACEAAGFVSPKLVAVFVLLGLGLLLGLVPVIEGLM